MQLFPTLLQTRELWVWVRPIELWLKLLRAASYVGLDCSMFHLWLCCLWIRITALTFRRRFNSYQVCSLGSMRPAIRRRFSPRATTSALIRSQSTRDLVAESSCSGKTNATSTKQSNLVVGGSRSQRWAGGMVCSPYPLPTSSCRCRSSTKRVAPACFSLYKQQAFSLPGDALPLSPVSVFNITMYSWYLVLSFTSYRYSQAVAYSTWIPHQGCTVGCTAGRRRPSMPPGSSGRLWSQDFGPQPFCTLKLYKRTAYNMMLLQGEHVIANKKPAVRIGMAWHDKAAIHTKDKCCEHACGTSCDQINVILRSSCVKNTPKRMSTLIYLVLI